MEVGSLEVAKVKICNDALAQLPVKRIQSLDEKSAQAVACQSAFDRILKELLRLVNWKFALKSTALALAKQTGEKRYYTIPADCTFMKDILDEQGEPIGSSWNVEGNQIVTKETKIIGQYISHEKALEKMDPLFQSALVYRLASEIAIELTGADSVMGRNYQRYQISLEQAKFENSREGIDPILDGNPFLDARI